MYNNSRTYEEEMAMMEETNYTSSSTDSGSAPKLVSKTPSAPSYEQELDMLEERNPYLTDSTPAPTPSPAPKADALPGSEAKVEPKPKSFSESPIVNAVKEFIELPTAPFNLGGTMSDGVSLALGGAIWVGVGYGAYVIYKKFNKKSTKKRKK